MIAHDLQSVVVLRVYREGIGQFGGGIVHRDAGIVNQISVALYGVRRGFLAAHDRGQFELVCYASGEREDEVTQRLRGSCDAWRDISPMVDQDAADRIRADGIDILVDLAGHAAGGRLLLFARKPAPVQVTWLGYPDTTGLDTVDYRLTDAIVDPEGEDRWSSERLLRLPDTMWCYGPRSGLPGVAPPPSLVNVYKELATDVPGYAAVARERILADGGFIEVPAAEAPAVAAPSSIRSWV